MMQTNTTYQRALQAVIYGLSIAIILFSPVVSALPEDHKKAIDRNSVHHDTTTYQTEDQCADTSIVLVGNSNTAKAFNFLKGKGLDDHQAAGVVGNLIAESGVFPKRKQGQPSSYKATMADLNEAIRLNKANPSNGFGIGIAQWTSWNRLENLVKSAGSGDPLSLEAQVQFLYEELPANGLTELEAAGDLRQATWIFLAFFERPATVVNQGLAKKPNQPTGGAAKATLDERVRLAEAATRGGSTGATASSTASGTCIESLGGPLSGDESEPSFKKIPGVAVDEPPAGNFTPSLCTKGFTVGADSLSKAIMQTYSPPVTSVGGFSCRQNTAGPGVSVHGVGRALDIMIDGTTPKGKEMGDKIRNVLINDAQRLGIQRIIWQRHIWSADQDGWRDYGGPNPHTDHLHVEVNLEASKNPQLGR